MTRRVVVTGMGALSPLGRGLKANWNALLNGKSGITKNTAFDVSDYSSKVAGQVPIGEKEGEFWPDSVLSPKEQRHVDKFILYGIAAGIDAMEDSGFTPESDYEKNRSAIITGSGIGGLQTISDGAILLENNSPRRLSPFVIPACLINLIAGHLSIKYGLQGPNLSVVTACATGTHAIIDATRLIKNDEADMVLCGSAESALHPVGVGGFSQMKALSTNFNDTPELASRPWDKDRDGFVMAEGAGALVLEEYEHAKKRGANIYAEVAGYAQTGDAYHITAPGGNGALRCMQGALNNAKLNPEEVDYINAHGTSTFLGDIVEINAIKSIFGTETGLAVSSTKSMTGHLLGAAGAIEAIYSILAINENVVPPTINLFNPIEEANGINLVPFTPLEKRVNVALSNSFGFGGTNGTVIFKKQV